MTEQQLSNANNIAYRMRGLANQVKGVDTADMREPGDCFDAATPETQAAVRTLLRADLTNQLNAARAELGAL